MRIDTSCMIWHTFGGFGYSSDAERGVSDPSIWPTSKPKRVHPGLSVRLDLVLDSLGWKWIRRQPTNKASLAWVSNRTS